MELDREMELPKKGFFWRFNTFGSSKRWFVITTTQFNTILTFYTLFYCFVEKKIIYFVTRCDASQGRKSKTGGGDKIISHSVIYPPNQFFCRWYWKHFFNTKLPSFGKIRRWGEGQNRSWDIPKMFPLSWNDRRMRIRGEREKVEEGFFSMSNQAQTTENWQARLWTVFLQSCLPPNDPLEHSFFRICDILSHNFTLLLSLCKRIFKK